MEAGLDRRFSQESADATFKVASALHPKFKLNWVRDDQVDSVRQLVKAALVKYDNEEECPRPATGIKSFFSSLKTKQSPAASHYSAFLLWAESEDEKMPEQLSQAFCAYNTSLASSAPVERLFSLGKRVLTPLRSRLSDNNFDCLVMLGCQK